MRVSRILWITLLGLSLALPSAALDPNRIARAKAKVAKADKLLKKEKYERAEELFREAIAVEPVLPSSYLGLGAALVGQRRYEDALEVLDGAESRYAGLDKEIQLAQTKALNMVDNTERVVEHLKESYGVFQRGPLSMGLDKTVIGRWNVEELGAIPAQVFYLEGICHLRSDRLAEGIERLRLCLMLDEAHELAQYNLAVALFTTGQLAAAQRHLDAAVAAGAEPHPAFVADLKRAIAEQDSTS